MKDSGLKPNMRLLILFFALLNLLYGDALIYKISAKNGNHLFIGGTIHILSKSDYPLPKEYFSAFNRADILYFETNLAATKTTLFSKMLITALSYPPNKTLQDDLNASTYALLQDYCNRHHIPLQNLQHFKVGMSGMNIMMAALNELHIDAMGVDEYFFNQAKEHNKPIGALESIETQIDIIAHMGEGNEDAFILSSLEDATHLKEQMHDIVRYFKTANVDALDKELLLELKEQYPKLYNALIVTRNRAWMEKIRPMFKRQKSAFILVGAMHLVGDDGLLQTLKREGYTVKMLRAK